MTYGMNKILAPFSTTAVAVFGVYFKLNSFIFYAGVWIKQWDHSDHCLQLRGEKEGKNPADDPVWYCDIRIDHVCRNVHFSRNTGQASAFV